MIVSTAQDATAQRLIEGRVNDAPNQNAAPRRFETGFSASYEYLCFYCRKHGFDLVYFKRAYELRKAGAKGRTKSMTWKQVLKAIDDRIRIPNGHEPIMRRVA